MSTDANVAAAAPAPYVLTSEISFSDAQLLERYQEFSSEVKASRTNPVHALGVHHDFARVLLNGAGLSANETATMRLKFRDMAERGGHIVAIPFPIADRLEAERRPFFSAIEKRLADEAAEREFAA
ncbi:MULTISPECIES: hypothetical protein [Methylosinus]|uniref:Uncharacterized protein n=1 Tax=Methylosinus trichosporium (strain ATCC 35070 / NCIMB 11131 / UNIQEM 75 / OB3b) TaxID=595536 RepID=A0A2D2CYV9_METT3|nr:MULTISPECIES: hypothetical protein [Methylosinus]ATQ67915.1 hypothetical protein CQW49_08465 [Methylosinus trichosporium OB3b]OBS54010.1 hypothetical protein A8B73_02850 [Methylosinus sp. 3S-1]